MELRKEGGGGEMASGEKQREKKQREQGRGKSK